MWEAFIEYKLYPPYVFEIVALFAGFYYYFHNPSINKAEKLFIFTMLFVLFFSATSLFYGMYTYFYGFKNIEFLEDTQFEKNYWIINFRAVVMYPAYSLYFIWNLHHVFWRKILYGLILFFIVSSVISFFLSDSFFISNSNFVRFFGAFLISLCAALYLVELMGSKRILNFRNELPFYISIGTLLFYLSFTPLLLLQKYIPGNDYFREVFGTILNVLNFIMYGLFTVGFLRKSIQFKRQRQEVRQQNI